MNTKQEYYTEYHNRVRELYIIEQTQHNYTTTKSDKSYVTLSSINEQDITSVLRVRKSTIFSQRLTQLTN